MFGGFYLRHLVLLSACLVFLLIVTSGRSASVGEAKNRQRQLQLSEKLLKMLNEHFHTFGRPRFGKRGHSSRDWTFPALPYMTDDGVGAKEAEVAQSVLPSAPVDSGFASGGDGGDGAPLEGQETEQLRNLLLYYN